MATDNWATSPQVGAASNGDKNGENLMFAKISVCVCACWSVFMSWECMTVRRGSLIESEKVAISGAVSFSFAAFFIFFSSDKDQVINLINIILCGDV